MRLMVRDRATNHTLLGRVMTESCALLPLHIVAKTQSLICRLGVRTSRSIIADSEVFPRFEDRKMDRQEFSYENSLRLDSIHSRGLRVVSTYEYNQRNMER